MPNRLASEQSPYLLQHANNPVDWYPWGPEAFEAARAAGKPIFLSIGYATCHWCHVMERESFENQGVADVLNDLFISIKVDREERPDVDRVYMTFVQATTGSGGWPMSVWLTPELQPFYGGTYFPPAQQWGRPGFVDVLTEIGRAWREDRLKVVKSAAEIVDRLSQLARGQDDRRMPTEAALTKTFQQFQQSFDTRRGGFGDAPKFPRPSELLFLLREYARLREDATARQASDAALAMVVQTLRAMALGGMRDHIGGGFHRYSVDGDWRVPHFEKMLYDQAQIVLACLEASQAADDPFFAQIAEDTLQYVRRDMTDPRGGFYSAEDADSFPVEPQDLKTSRPHDLQKVEGAFYVWTADEIKRHLGDDSAVFEARYGILPNGNAPFDPQNEFVNKNLLYTAQSIAEIARSTNKAPIEVAEALLRARLILFDTRELRPRPQLDDKVLTAWNGLMIAAFARASRVLGGGALGQENIENPTAADLQSAIAAASFIRDVMWNAQTRTLLRRYRAGDAAIKGYAEDYAGLIFGVLELFQATGDPQWLAWARELQQRQDELFWDASGGGWFSTTGADPSVLVRMKEDYDGAEPAPTSVSAMNLLTLAHLTGERAYSDRAGEAIASFGGRLEQTGRAVPLMAAALSASIAESEQIVIVGPRDSGETAALWTAAHKRYRPFSVVTRVEPSTQAALAVHMPWTSDMKMMDGKPTVYICRGFACDAPATDPSVFSPRSLGEGALE
ncbi:MAG: thioredoxin domain-containing protein [Cyanobacteria bacterium]|nr:thioredoxin domain-containing protein [Cyanobacteriota bacterium]